MPTPTLRKVKLRNTRVLYRVAYDVPLAKKNGQFKVQDDSRIRASIPTLRYLIKQRCKIVILTWAGRPDGKVVEKYKLDPVAKRLSALLRHPVRKLNDCVGPEVTKVVAGMQPGEVVLLENVRFHPEEETKNFAFIKKLTALGDMQVFDAFAQAHRDVSSIVGPQRYLPTVSGFTVEREVATLSRMMLRPKRPFVAIIGGAKIEDKVALVSQLLKKADYVLLGGMSANTVLQIKGLQVGKSRVSSEAANVARRLELTNLKLKIPVDVVTATRINPKVKTNLRAVSKVKSNEMLLDIGPDTVELYSSIIKKAKTVLWSGPMGYFEMPPFAKGTIAVARVLAGVKGETIVGGGDTEAALEAAGVEKRIDFVSTGGGAMLEFLSGKPLPGLKYLKLPKHPNMPTLKIKRITAHEILDSRGDPTIQTTVVLSDGTIAVAAVPSGASKGINEAWELRDGDPKRYGGLGTLKACRHVNTVIFKALLGMNPIDQRRIDRRMIELDGTDNKSKLGANAILSVSMAVARAAAVAKKEPLYQRIAGLAQLTKTPLKLPTPIFNLFNGGKHADTNIDLQEFWLVPNGFRKIQDQVRLGAEVFHALKDILHKDSRDTDVGNEGGYAPTVDRTTQVFDWMMMGIRQAGYRPGIDASLGLDAGSTTFYDSKLNRYHLSADRKNYTTAELIGQYRQWSAKYPIRWLEDGLREDDWIGWRQMTVSLGRRLTLVGDDLFCTNIRLLKKAIDANVANALLVKLNQIGTVTETIEAVLMAKRYKYQTIVSHRSGETADDFIADLAVGLRADFIKAGAPSRGERVVKYNRLMAIAENITKK